MKSSVQEGGRLRCEITVWYIRARSGLSFCSESSVITTSRCGHRGKGSRGVEVSGDDTARGMSGSMPLPPPRSDTEPACWWPDGSNEDTLAQMRSPR